MQLRWIATTSDTLSTGRELPAWHLHPRSGPKMGFQGFGEQRVSRRPTARLRSVAQDTSIMCQQCTPQIRLRMKVHGRRILLVALDVMPIGLAARLARPCARFEPASKRSRRYFRTPFFATSRPQAPANHESWWSSLTAGKTPPSSRQACVSLTIETLSAKRSRTRSQSKERVRRRSRLSWLDNPCLRSN